MSNWRIALVLTLVLIVAPALADPTDPDPDGVGFYWESTALTNCLITEPFLVFEGWICLTQASDPEGVYGWECSWELTPNLIHLGTQYNGLAVDVGIPPDFLVGLFEPLPWEPSIWLANFLFLLLDFEPAEIYLRPASIQSLPGHMAYAGGSDVGNILPMYPSTGSHDIPVAVINGDCPVSAVETSWGGVKAMYK